MIRPEGAQGYDRRHDASAPVALEIYDYFERAIDDHIANPRDDVLSAMIAANLIEREAAQEAVDALVAADMIEQEAADEALAAVLAAEEVEAEVDTN